MSTRGRTMGVTMAVCALTGIVMAAVIILSSAPTDTIRHSLTTSRGLTNLLFLASLTTLPVTVSTAVLASLVVHRAIMRDEKRRPVTSWIAAGCGYGIALGTAGTVATFGVFSVIVGTWPEPALFVVTAIAGAFGGVIAGSIVGVYASRAARR